MSASVMPSPACAPKVGSFALLACLLLAGPAAAFRFVTTSDSHVSSDMNTESGVVFGYVISRIDGLGPRPDFWVFGGDAYHSASDSAEAMALWQEWKYIADPLADIPVYPAIGNHDANIYNHDWDGTGPFRASWPDLPQNGPPEHPGTVYSFRHQNAIFCVVNTNLYYPATYAARFKVDQAQRDWLSAVLDTTTAVHRFVIGHVEAWPPSDGSSHSSLQWNAADRDAFWQVMASGGVQAYVCGHIHLWNKDYFAASGFGNPPADTSVRQIICGGAGGSLVSGYGGYFYHFVVWDIDGPSVVARVIDSYGVLRDSLKYTVATGFAGPPPAGTPGRPGISGLRLASGGIRWEGYGGECSVEVFNIAGRKVWSGIGSGGLAGWPGNRGRAGSGAYLVRVRPSNWRPGGQALGRVLLIR
jgi:3',5'-cyclic AMP phosphodiesterase CpdA